MKNEFRLYDPADLLWESERPQATVDWSGSGLSNDEFLEFRDAPGARFSDFLTASNDWVVLYEGGHQRTGDLNRTGATTYFRIVAFLAKKSQLPRLNDSFQAGALRLPYYLCHDRFRHELPAALPESRSYPSSDLKPLLGISKNRFRGQKNLSIAMLLPEAPCS